MTFSSICASFYFFVLFGGANTRKQSKQSEGACICNSDLQPPFFLWRCYMQHVKPPRQLHRLLPDTLCRFESASPLLVLELLGELLSTPPSRGRRWLTDTCSMKEVPYFLKYHHSNIWERKQKDRITQRGHSSKHREAGRLDALSVFPANQIFR